MPSVDIDGIATRYEVIGSGPPLLMYAPGGFDAVVETWSAQGVYAKIKLLDHLPKSFSCILFDRRECGQSGGRVEPIPWRDYVAQGKGLLDHLKIPRAHLIGGCMGCAPVAAFAVAHPEMVASMVLYGRSAAPNIAFEPSAFCRASWLCAKRRPRRSRRSRAPGGQAVRRRPARRAVGFGDQARRGIRRSLCPAGSDKYTRICEAMRDACSIATPLPARSPKTDAHRGSGSDRARP